MPIREIHPVVNRETGENTDFYAMADPIVLVKIGQLMRRRAQPREMTDKLGPQLFGHGIHERNRLSINQQSVTHPVLLFLVTLAQGVEIHPAGRVFVVNFIRQRLPENLVLFGFSGNQECDKFTLLNGWQVVCLLFELCQRHKWDDTANGRNCQTVGAAQQTVALFARVLSARCFTAAAFGSTAMKNQPSLRALTLTMNFRPHLRALVITGAFLAAGQITVGAERTRRASASASAMKRTTPSGKFWPVPSSKAPEYWRTPPPFSHRDSTSVLDKAHLKEDLARQAEALAAPEGYIPFVLRKIAECEIAFGPDAPETLSWVSFQARYASSLDNEGWDRYALFRRVYEARVRTLGREHPDTLESLSELADSAFSYLPVNDGFELTRRAYLGSEKALGSAHPLTIYRLAELVSTLEFRGKYAEAERLCRRLVAIGAKVQLPETEIDYEALFHLADLCLRSGKIAEAEAYFRRSLVFVDRVYGPVSQWTCEAMNNVGAALAMKGKYDEAEAILLQAYERFDSRNDHVRSMPYEWTLVPGAIANNLGLVYYARKQYAKALPFLEEAEGGCVHSFGLRSVQVKTYAGFLPFVRRQISPVDIYGVARNRR